MRLLVASLAMFGLMMTAPAVAAPVAYRLNSDHADVTFEVDHIGFTVKHGWFREMTGALTLDQERPEGSNVEVTIRASSIDTNHAQRDTELRGPRFFDTERFPEIRFVSTRIVRTGEHTADVEGNLTMHGVSKRVVLQARLNKVGLNPFDQSPTVGFRATTRLRRSEFGIAAFLPAIGDEVVVAIDAEFTAAR